MKNDSFLSVVFVFEQFSPSLFTIIRDCEKELNRLYTDYEILLIRQGPLLSTEENPEEIKLLQEVPSIRYIQLTNQVSDDVAWAAGLENAIGDFIVLLDPNRDPVSVLGPVVRKCREGFDVVVGVAPQNASLGYRLFRRSAEIILNAIDYHLPKNATGLRCLSRRAVNAVTSSGRYHHQLYLRIQKTGYPSTILSYRQLNTKEENKSLFSGIHQLLHLMVFNSSRPLRWMSLMGFSGSCAAFFFAVYSLFIHLLKGNVVEGWTTTILFLSFLFMLQFIMLTFLGEYLGRLLDEQGKLQNYAVVFEKNSTVMVNQDRINVLTEPVSDSMNKVQTGRNK